MILEYLFKEGVLAVQKDGLKAKHDHIDVPNLHVMMVMKSLCSRDLVKEKFNWQWFYYFLSDTGIEHLREELHLPSTEQPATLTKQTKLFRPGGPQGDEEDRKGGRKGKGKGFGKGKGWRRDDNGDGEKPEAAAEE